eukprot:140918_1
MTSFNFASRTDEGTVFLMAGLLLAIFMPTSLFFGYQMFKRRANVTVNKRYPTITFFTAICFSLRLITSAITLILLGTKEIDITYVGYKILLVFDNIFLYLFLILLLWRSWNINYDLQWINNSVADEQWRLIIQAQDEVLIEQGRKLSFYLKYNSTFGRSSFCGKIFIPIFFIIYFLLINIPLLVTDDFTSDQSISSLLSRLTFIITFFILILLFIITPKKVAGNTDGFYIIKELKIIFVFNLFIFIIAFIGFIYGRFVYETRIDQRRYVYILIEESLYFAFEWLIVMFSTFYVLGKTGEIMQKYHLSRNRGKTNMKMIKLDKNVNTQLYQALQKDEVFEEFLKHLAAEFSLQTMLALIEFLQFQRYCHKYFIKNPIAYQTLLPENETLSLESDQIRLPKDLPQSDIVFLNSESEVTLDLQDFFSRTQSKAYNLYEKYIAPGCELPVPFSDETRQKYIDKMRDLNVWLFESEDVKNLYDMMHFLDSSIKDIYQLLSASYSTFHNKADQLLLSQEI